MGWAESGFKMLRKVKESFPEMKSWVKSLENSKVLVV